MTPTNPAELFQFHQLKEDDSHCELYCEDLKIKDLAEKFGTPLYLYSATALKQRSALLVKTLKDDLKATFSPQGVKIHFAVKACSNLNILSLLREAGLSADIVSGGELFRCLQSGFEPGDIVFSGVGKTHHELQEALNANVGFINVESYDELLLLDYLAGKRNDAEKLGRPKVALRINPDVDPQTHPYISTGLRENKFGFLLEEAAEILEGKTGPYLKHIEISGLSCHIGSQILSLKPFEDAWVSLRDFALKYKNQIKSLDLGGGLGISYGDEVEIPVESYAATISKVFQGTSFKLSVELGRWIVGAAAVLVGQLVSIKRREDQTFYILDTGMTELMRPALYGATHPAVPVSFEVSSPLKPVHLVGPVCESSDVFQKDAVLPELHVGDFVALGCTGAYGFSMANQYNSRPRPPEILVEGRSVQVIRERETYADLIAGEHG